MRDKGKVFIFSSVHRYDDVRIFHKQALSLVQAGYCVEIHAPADFDEQFIQGVYVKGMKPARNRCHRLWQGWQLYRRGLSSKADLFHFHDPELLYWGWKLGQKSGRPVIYDAHEDLPKQIHTKPWIPLWLRPWVSTWVKRVEKRLARHMSAVVTATNSIAASFQMEGVSQVTVIKNYPLPFKGKPMLEMSGENALLYVGGISYLRGYREMIAMMERLPADLAPTLHLIGPLQHIEVSVEEIEKLRQQGIYLHGRIPFDEVQNWLASGAVGMVCLHPLENYRESLPIKLFEYMAAGIPVVATDFPLWRDIVVGNQCGVVVDPLNPEEMAEEVLKLLQDKGLRNRMGENGKRAYQREFNWKQEANKLITLYSSLISKRDVN
ncbi:glycosyltransferase family 4 protein [Mechercharimyces sp. CAU 1602]|uniref:glycosyltransferase family 4 protein n=1 Tax=Mechercharimyces sp. CAU 1602 TaxID=2973933 RepID=UPI002163EDD8|nr:glycosyltransferase family 4 protein [Mechercharimyces sp. CAU 1602]MCS1352249.1 glycosyltransferase family 4 protein [Mechercharimyces sp. CAU 1602]